MMLNTSNYYDSIAPGYNELHGEEQDKKLRDFLDRMRIKDNITLLDVGCGTGRSAGILEQYRIEWHGLEPSAGLILEALHETRKKIRQGVAEQIPWPDKTFDVVLSITAVQNYDDPEKGITEMSRVTKSKGSLLVSFPKKSGRAAVYDSIIRKKLTVMHAFEQEHDKMYICVQRNETRHA